MSLLDRFRKKTPKESTTQVVPEMVSIDDNSAIVFGVTWKPVVAQGAREAVKKQIHAEKATHTLEHERQIAYATLDNAANLPEHLFVASAVMAKEIPDDAMFVLGIDEDTFWVALTREREPFRVDVVLRETTTSEVLAFAREELSKVRTQAGKDFRVYTNIPHSGFNDATEITMQFLVEATRLSAETFQSVEGKSISSNNRVPVLIVALVVFSFTGQQAWKYLGSKNGGLPTTTAPAVDVRELWSDKIASWENSTPAPDPQSLMAVTRSLHEVPVRWDGWMLQAAICAINESMKSMPWQCEANYTRLPNGMLSEDMRQQIPEDWSVQFSPLNEMRTSWTIEGTGTGLSIANLPAQEFHLVHTSSSFQKLEAAMTQPPGFSFTPVEIDAPIMPDGQVVTTIDERIKGLTQARISLTTPLRTLDVFSAQSLPVSWRRISVTPHADSKSFQASIQASSLMAQAEGVIYANR